MEIRIFKIILSLLLLIFTVLACAIPTDTPSTELQTTSTPQIDVTAIGTEPPITPITPITGEGLCANVYYPVREGATWNYKSTDGNAGEHDFTDTITSVRDDGFTLSTKIGDGTHAQDWNCSTEGLVALQFGGGPAALLNVQDLQLDLQVINVSGVTFPKEIQPGDQWNHNLDLEGNATIVGREVTATGTAQTTFNAVGTETVTVPAGTFDALKIQADTTLNMTAESSGLSVPVTLSGTYTYWLVQGVGWVKASATGSVAGKSFSETAELQTYNIP